MRDFDLDQYREWFDCARLDRNELGVLEVTLHRDGGSLEDWGGSDLAELGLLFSVISHDPANRVVVLTGTGDNFLKTAPVDRAVNTPLASTSWVRADAWARRLQRNLLNIEVPVIAAVNGPVEVHSDIVVSSDIIVAAEEAWFDDRVHFPSGIVPGDGAMIAWLPLLGPNRTRQFLMLGERISSTEARQLGIVAEVLPRGEVLTRARQIANEMARNTDQVLRYTRMIGTRTQRRHIEADLGQSTALLGLAATEYFPGGLTTPPGAAQE